MLTPEQKEEMKRDGYTIVRGCVPSAMLDAAKRAIHANLATEGLPPDKLTQFAAQTYCPSLTRESVITDLFNQTPIFTLCEEFVGEGNLLSAGSGQIALRFSRPTAEHPKFSGHIDGRGTGTNGIPEGQFHRGFTMLAVILLSDLPDIYSGNFTVWPGTHVLFEKIFQEQGPEALAKAIDTMDVGAEPVQITGKAGDVVLMHHQTVHTAAPNASPNIRYAVIFRGVHKDAKENGVAAMTDIWREWPGLK
jgi:Phytanoyl-CoA dioxygenase (PhyH)